MEEKVKVTIRVDKETKKALYRLKELGEIGSYSEAARRALYKMIHEIGKKYFK